MRKKIFPLTIVLMLFGGLVFNGCDKDNQNSPVEPDLTLTAEVKGLVFANLTEQNDTMPGIKWEFAPAGTLIHVRINAAQYSADADGFFQYTATVESDGSFSVEVPATKKGIAVELIPVDFEAQKVVGQWQYDPGLDADVWKGESKRAVYSSLTYNVGGIVPDGVRIQDIYYASDI